MVCCGPSISDGTCVILDFIVSALQNGGYIMHSSASWTKKFYFQAKNNKRVEQGSCGVLFCSNCAMFKIVTRPQW